AERRAIFARIDADPERFEGTPTRWAAFDGPAHGPLSWFGRLGTGDILARYRTGGAARGLALLRRISEIFARDGNVYEAYDMKGEPARGTAGWGNYAEHAGGYVWALVEGPFGISFESDAMALAEIRPRFPAEWGSAGLRFYLRGTRVDLEYLSKGRTASVTFSGQGRPVAIRVIPPDGSAPCIVRAGTGEGARIQWRTE
ncbi:MAG: hypothetical protein JXP34_11615, partial [Planctomycetes bacterium]|nr:hypothetical protein [Planctomycetota bacterium]